MIGGLTRIEGAWVGALAFIVINNYVRDSWLTDLLDTLWIGGSFNTIIGLVFLVIVIVSPDGLMGVWDRLWESGPPRWRIAEASAVTAIPAGEKVVEAWREEDCAQIVSAGRFSAWPCAIVNQGGQQA